MKLTPGQTVQGRYRIVRLLGEGGFGAVYLVQDLRLGSKHMALKESFDSSPAAQQQFQLEASLLANLSHPHLPRVSDHFIEPSGRQYLVMDYVEGQDLTEIVIQRQAPLPESQAVAWLIQVCQAVAHLHSQQPNPIIHRDIKPSNIKITPDGWAVLVDFGIAKIYVPKKGTAPIAKAVSPGFSPPEQYAGGTDARSDVYSLGATLYTLVTANVPEDALDRLTQGVRLTPPSRYNRRLAPALEQIILQAMELDPRRRFPSARELGQALQACQSGQPLPAVVAAGQVCPRCATLNRPGARFCNRDGTPLAAPAPVAVPTPAAPSIAPELNFELGNAYARNGQLDQAIQAYQQALAGGLSDPALYHNLGLTYILADRYPEAIASLRQGLSRTPQDSDLLFQLGRAYYLNDQLAESAQALEQARSLHPHDPACRMLLGAVLQDQGRHAEAIAELEQAARLQTDSAVAHYLLGKSYFNTRQLDRAEKAFLEAVRLEPGDASHHYYLGLTRHRQKKPDLAIQALRQAVQLESNHFPALYYLGEAYAAQQNWHEAIAHFQRAAPMDPSDPDPHIGLCVCYAMLNRRSDAIAAIRQALAIDPNNQRAREILSKL